MGRPPGIVAAQNIALDGHYMDSGRFTRAPRRPHFLKFLLIFDEQATKARHALDGGLQRPLFFRQFQPEAPAHAPKRLAHKAARGSRTHSYYLNASLGGTTKMLHFLRSKDKVLLSAEVTVRRARRRGPFLPETWRTP